MFDQSHAAALKPRKLCLVVDDSPTVRRVAGRILRELDMEVVEADNGRTALEKCSAQMPDSILLDWNMPMMTGIEFLRALRQLDRGDCPRVILCTTETDVQHVKEPFDSGANEYIMKPFDAETLKSKVLGSTEAAGVAR